MTPQEAWSAAYHQLELQLDRSSFDTWLRHAHYIGYETTDGIAAKRAIDGGVFIIGVHNDYARDMLQHRLYRTVCKVVSDMAGYHSDLRFEVQRKGMNGVAKSQQDHKPEQMPLFRFMEQQNSLQDDDTPINPFAKHDQRDVQQQTPGFLRQDTVSANQENFSQSIPDERTPDMIDEGPSLPWHQLIKSPHNKNVDLVDSHFNATMIFDRFIVNKSNQMVYDASRAIADYPGNIYNPFLVYGGVGLGKTHILLAIAHACKLRGLRTLYLTTEAFTNDLIDAIRNRTTAMFRDKYRSVDVLLVDDIQFITGKEATQEEFFHTFNALVNFNKQVVLASDRHPRDLVLLEDRLRSRFEGGLVADIQPPEYETRLAILRMWGQEVVQEQGLTVEDRFLDKIAQQGSTNVRELRGQFNKIVAQAKLGRLSLPSIEDTLLRYHQPRHRMTIIEIIEAVARTHGFQARDLIGKRRTARVNHARQIAMYLARELTEYSLPQIGEAFGGRAHTTVLHGWSRINEDLQDDRLLEARLNKIKHLLIGEN